jgi:6-phosphogluconolactonase
LYASDSAHNWIWGFGVASTGAISSLPNFPINGASGPSALVVGRTGNRLYQVGTGADVVQTYSVGLDGSVSPFGLATATGAAPAALAINPAGSLLFVANSGADSLSRYAVGSDGLLSALGTTLTGQGPDAVAVTPDGNKLYVANGTDGTISIFTVESAGSLTEVGSPVAAGTDPIALSLTPDGHYLYAANSGDGSISGWSIGADGSLAPLSGSPYPAGTGVSGLAMAPDGVRMISADLTAATITRYSIASSGALSAVGTTTGPTGIESVAVSPDGKHAYAAGTASVAAYDFSSNGSLTPAAGSPITAVGAHNALVVTPDQAPQGGFTTSRTNSTVTFLGIGADPDGTPAIWRWDFGDGGSGTGQTIKHTYQPGTYTATLTITDNEGCSTTDVFTGQSLLCAGSTSSTWTDTVYVPGPPGVPDDPPCLHDGNDGFCGTPDEKAPTVQVLGFTDGATISTLDAPTELVGTVTPDPSGIKEILLRFTKAAGTVVKTRAVTRRVCHKVKGEKRCRTRPLYKKTCRKIKGKRHCTRRKVVKTVGKVSMCLTVSGTKNYLIKVECSKVKWVSVQGDTTFRYDLPVALSTGSYVVDAIATDGVGNSDVLQEGRNRMAFKVVKTASNQGGDSTGTGSGTGGTTTTPITDTGSPFGR